MKTSLFIILTITAALLFFVANVGANEAFDHMTCQYPSRQSNPVDGCDNTDPACPEEIKGGTCKPHVEAKDKTPQPTAQPTKAPIVEPAKHSCYN